MSFIFIVTKHTPFIYEDRSVVLRNIFFFFLAQKKKKSGFRSMSYHQHIVFGCETPNLASTNDSYTYKRNDKITQFMRCRLFLPYMRPNYRKYSSEGDTMYRFVRFIELILLGNFTQVSFQRFSFSQKPYIDFEVVSCDSKIATKWKR